jgi:hypothetical protein
MNTETVLEKITFKEFKERVADQDGFGKTRRILYYGFIPDGHRWKYYLPMVGRKDECLKVAYRLFHGENLNEYEQSLRNKYIHEGEYKYHITFNFTSSLWMNSEVKFQDNQIVEPE